MFKWILRLIGLNPKDNTRNYSGRDGGSFCLNYQKESIERPNWYYVDFENKTVYYDPNFMNISALEIFAKK